LKTDADLITLGQTALLKAI